MDKHLKTVFSHFQCCLVYIENFYVSVVLCIHKHFAFLFTDIYMYVLSLVAVSVVMVAAIATLTFIAFLLVSATLLCWWKGQQSLDAFGQLKQTPLFKRLKSTEHSPHSPPQYRWSVSYILALYTL